MTRRATLLLATLAGFPAAVSAQELVRVTYSWLEVQGNTVTPVTAPNSVVDPGEGARISIHIQALINGTNAVGQTTTYIPPPPPGFGTVRGIASMVYNLRGDSGLPTAAGTWGPRSVSGFFSVGAFGGQSLLNGALFDSFGGGQFVAPGGSANSTNPISNAFRGVWTPLSYSPRTVGFVAEGGTAAPPGQHNGILVCYGYDLVDPSDPTSEIYDRLMTKYIGSDFGAGVSIPIAPAPASIALLGLGALITLPHRSRRGPRT